MYLKSTPLLYKYINVYKELDGDDDLARVTSCLVDLRENTM